MLHHECRGVFGMQEIQQIAFLRQTRDEITTNRHNIKMTKRRRQNDVHTDTEIRRRSRFRDLFGRFNLFRKRLCEVFGLE